MREERRVTLGCCWMDRRRILMAWVNLVILFVYLLSGGLRRSVLAEMMNWRFSWAMLSRGEGLVILGLGRKWLVT